MSNNSGKVPLPGQGQAVAPTDSFFVRRLVLDTLHHYTALSNNSTVHHLNGQKEDMEQKRSVIWRATLDRYADEIAAIQAELESTRADFDQRIDAHRARLQKFLHAISSDLQRREGFYAPPSAPDSPETTPGDVTSQYSTPREGYTFPDLHSLR
jgi:hypothetical protein